MNYIYNQLTWQWQVQACTFIFLSRNWKMQALVCTAKWIPAECHWLTCVFLQVQATLKRQWMQYKVQWGQRRREHCSMRSTSYTTTSITEVPAFMFHHDCNSEHLNGRHTDDSELIALKTRETYAWGIKHQRNACECPESERRPWKMENPLLADHTDKVLASSSAPDDAYRITTWHQVPV